MNDTFDPMQGPRLAPAWTAALDLLSDYEWHRWTDVVTRMIEHSDVQPKTASNLIHAGIRNEMFARRGKYPNREVRKI